MNIKLFADIESDRRLRPALLQPRLQDPPGAPGRAVHVQIPLVLLGALQNLPAGSRSAHLPVTSPPRRQRPPLDNIKLIYIDDTTHVSFGLLFCQKIREATFCVVRTKRWMSPRCVFTDPFVLPYCYDLHSSAVLFTIAPDS